MTMSIKMKDSGIKWIGNIPEHWYVMPNKYVMYKVKEIQDIYNNEDILSLSTDGVKIRDLDAGGKMPTTFDGYQKVEPGRLLMCLFDIDVTPRCIGLIKDKGLTSPSYSQFIVRENGYAPYYYYYYLNLDFDKILVHLAKNLRHSLTEDQLGAINVLVPSLSEQKSIADYLDKKIGEIDSAIKEANNLIDKYKSYKQSIITKAVTKGIIPNVSMKDSGLPWIGEIPEHWEKKRGKYILSYLQKPIQEDDEVITCFRDGEVTLRSNRREEGFTISEKEIGYQGIDINDLVIHGMDGFAGAIGISDSRGKASPVLVVLDSGENKRYLMYYLRSLAYRDVFLALATGIRVRSCDLRWNKIANTAFIIPPIEEQQDIADYLDDKCAQIDSIIESKNNLIKQLQEYKKSIIFEYVTGKKEVPNG